MARAPLPEPMREVASYWRRAWADAKPRTKDFVKEHLAVEVALLLLVFAIAAAARNEGDVSTTLLYPLGAAVALLVGSLAWNLVSAPVHLEQAAIASPASPPSPQVAVDDVLQEVGTNRKRLEEARGLGRYPYDFILVSDRWHAHSSTFSISGLSATRYRGDQFYTAADHLNRLAQRRESNGAEVLEDDDLEGALERLDRLEQSLREHGDPDYQPPPEFDLSGQIEHGNWAVRFGAPAQVWRHGAFIWAWVENHGSTATFAAQILDVTGVPESWGDYFVAEPAWDQKNSAAIEIPHRHRRRLKLASVLRKPRGFWFWTTEGQTELPGWQWNMGKDETAEIAFVLEVTNIATDQSVRKRGLISIPADTGHADFSLEAVAP